MKSNMNKLIVSAALLWSGINIAPAVAPLTTLVSNLSPVTDMQDDWQLGPYLLQSFTTGAGATLNTLKIGSSWTLDNSPTVSLLDSGRNLVASFVYNSNSGGVNYSVQGGSFALQGSSTYFVQLANGNGYLNVTMAPTEIGLPSWTIGNGFFIGSDSSASTQSSQIMQFSLSGVPEPSALSLIALGLGGLAMIRRRRSRA
jgi:hypothetical protein